MLPLVPFFAQTVAVGVGDRTELRLIVENKDRTPEAETVPFGVITFGGRHSSLSLRYSPRFTLTPLDSPDRHINIFHTASVLSITTVGRTTFRAGVSGGYGKRDFSLAALQGSGVTPTTPRDQGTGTGAPGTGTPGTGTPGTGTPGTGTPGTGTPGAPGTVGAGPTIPPATQAFRTVRYAFVRFEVAVIRELTRRDTLAGILGYELSGGLGRDEASYPVLRGPDATLQYSYKLSRQDTLRTSWRTQYRDSSEGSRFLSSGVEQSYLHRFSNYITLGIGAGITYARVEDKDGNVTSSVYPTFGAASGAAFQYQTKVEGGILTLSAGARYSPELDQSRVVIDPRLGIFAGAFYTRKALSLYLTTSSTVSLAPNSPGAVDSVGAALGSAYRLGGGFVVDGGIRAAWQTYEQVEVIPPSYAMFIALSWGAPIYGGGTYAPPTQGGGYR